MTIRITICRFLVGVLALIVVCSCKKSDKDGTTNDRMSSLAKATDEGMRTALTNWTTTNGVNLATNRELASNVEEFVQGVTKSATNEVTLESLAASDFLTQLLEQQRLPGVLRGEHGHLTSDRYDTVISNNAVVMTYPASRTFHLVKNGETSTNNYTLAKQAKDSEWKLQKAWQTDSNGQIIQEWPVQ